MAFILAFGGSTPLFGPMYSALPGIGLFRNQERSLSIFGMAAALLAGYGVKSLVGRELVGRRTWFPLLGVAALLVLGMIRWLVPLGGIQPPLL